MEREIVRYLLEQLEGRFSFYKVNSEIIEAQIDNSEIIREFTENKIKHIIDELIDKKRK